MYGPDPGFHSQSPPPHKKEKEKEGLAWVYMRPGEAQLGEQ
jgi:hypothetical protein